MTETIFEDPIWDQEPIFAEQESRISKSKYKYDQVSSSIKASVFCMDFVAKHTRGVNVFTNRLFQYLFNSIDDYINSIKNNEKTEKELAEKLF